MALIVVMLVMLVITLLSVGLVAQATGQLPLARSVQDQEAAQAGVEDYISSLNTNANYWTTAANNTKAWTPIPGGANTESFTYFADTSQTPRSGLITITSTGCSAAKAVAGSCKGVMQTVRESVRRAGFLDYVYFTDYEIVDPNLLNNVNCGNPPNHQWENGGPNANCSIIQFASADTLNGPIHSNDAFHICGNPAFNGPMDSYYNSNKGAGFVNSGVYLKPGNCSATPTFQRSGDPAAGLDLPMPQVNSIAALANPTLAPPGTSGCLFSGATTLAFRYTSAGVGYVDYSSPNTDFRTTDLSWNGTLCGYPPTGTTSGTIPAASLAAGIVIYDQNVPSTNPNFTTCSASSSCSGDASIGNTVAAQLPTGQLGGLAGQLTIGADDNIIITNNVTYHSFPAGNDLPGLVATNYVEIPHPGTTTCDKHNNCTTTYSGMQNLTIDASILALKHSFYVQNWDQGPSLGTLTVNGGIAQVFRGPVATSSGGNIVTGYAKAYSYDARMAYMSPPYFATPAIVSWHKTSFTALNTCSVPSAGC